MIKIKKHPTYEVIFGEGQDCGLAAIGVIKHVEQSQLFNNARRGRHPSGIYSVSISRVSEKVISFCQKLEPFLSSNFEDLDKIDRKHKEITDYAELAIYAAAEHVDDLMNIAQGFFPNEKSRKKTGYVAFEESIKQSKRHVSMLANKIKHQQLRIRLSVTEYITPSRRGLLYGYVLEDVEDGVSGPNKEIHANHNVFSLTSLAWEILVFLFRASDALNIFLRDRGIQSERTDVEYSIFNDAISAAARLPLYAFEEDHIFDKFTINIKARKGDPVFSSNLYGSIMLPWSACQKIRLGRVAMYTTTDGHTESFSLIAPKQVSLKYWA